MGRREDYLVPSRFLLTTGHLVVVILALGSMAGNVANGLPATASAGDVTRATASLRAALAISLIALGVQLAGLLSGVTLLHARLNVMHCLLHFFGGVLTAWFIADQWGYTSYWWIASFFSFLPGLAEVATIAASRAVLR